MSTLAKQTLGRQLHRSPELRKGPGGRVVERAHKLADHAGTRLQWLPPLLARVALGGTFMSTGWGKLHNLPKVTGFFADLGLPAPAFLAGLVAATEFACGLLILIGLITRLAAIPLIVVLAMAIVTARLGDVHSFFDFLGLQELTYALLLFWLVIAGPGRVSLDNVLVQRSRDSNPPTEETKS